MLGRCLKGSNTAVAVNFTYLRLPQHIAIAQDSVERSIACPLDSRTPNPDRVKGAGALTLRREFGGEFGVKALNS